MKKIILISILISLLLLSACGTINIEQKLYRDGTFDLSIQATSDNDMFVEMVEEALGDSEGAILTELEDGVEYKFEKINLKNESFNNTFAHMWAINQEFKFPYNYVTLDYDNVVEESEEDDFGMTPKLYFTFDPFGKIVDTNGVYVDGKSKVRFDLNKNKNYTVTFRYFCLFSFMCGTDRIPQREQTDYSLDYEDSDEGAMDGDMDFDFDFFGDDETYESGEVTELELECYDFDFSHEYYALGYEYDLTFSDNNYNVVALEGTVDLTVKSLTYDETEDEYLEGEVVYITSYDLIGEDRLQYFDEDYGYEMALLWADIPEFDSAESQYGILYVDFTDLEGNVFSVMCGEDASWNGCQIRYYEY